MCSCHELFVISVGGLLNVEIVMSVFAISTFLKEIAGVVEEVFAVSEKEGRNVEARGAPSCGPTVVSIIKAAFASQSIGISFLFV